MSDYLTGTIWRIDPSSEATPLASGLLGPEGIAAFGNWLFVAEVLTDRISAINLDTGATTTLATIDLGLESAPTGIPPYGTLNGLTIDSKRKILYVANDKTNQVFSYRLTLP